MTREEAYERACDLLGPRAACFNLIGLCYIGRWETLAELEGVREELWCFATKRQAVHVYASGTSWVDAWRRLEKQWARRAPLLGPGEHGGLAKQGR